MGENKWVKRFVEVKGVVGGGAASKVVDPRRAQETGSVEAETSRLPGRLGRVWRTSEWETCTRIRITLNQQLRSYRPHNYPSLM